ncbi:uncharacterized protein TNCV_3054111, partial [Trichonephila clavipes]
MTHKLAPHSVTQTSPPHQREGYETRQILRQSIFGDFLVAPELKLMVQQRHYRSLLHERDYCNRDQT